MSNLSSQELLARVDVLLAIIDAPDEEGMVFESEENPYDLVGSEGDAEACAQPWCGTEEIEEPVSSRAVTQEHTERIALAVTLVVTTVIMAAIVAWVCYEVYVFGALVGLVLWALVNAL